jgi:hypothetical protein
MTREERNARNKYLTIVNERGIYMWRDPAPFRERLTQLHKCMFFTQISALTGIAESTLKDHYYNERSTVHVDTVKKLFAIPLPSGDIPSNEDRKRGAVRIVHGLLARGFSLMVMTEFLPTTYASLSNLSSENSAGWHGMSTEMYAHFVTMATKLEKAKPVDFGIAIVTQNMNKSRARNNQWAPIGCWDLDTVHRADVFPEWTGACGTIEGYRLHLAYDILVKRIKRSQHSDRRSVLCEPCLDAKKEYTSKRPSDVNRAAMFLAFEKGESIRDVAADFHCSTRTVQRFRAEWKEACDG